MIKIVGGKITLYAVQDALASTLFVVKPKQNLSRCVAPAPLNVQTVPLLRSLGDFGDYFATNRVGTKVPLSQKVDLQSSTYFNRTN